MTSKTTQGCFFEAEERMKKHFPNNALILLRILSIRIFILNNFGRLFFRQRVGGKMFSVMKAVVWLGYQLSVEKSFLISQTVAFEML